MTLNQNISAPPKPMRTLKELSTKLHSSHMFHRHDTLFELLYTHLSFYVCVQELLKYSTDCEGTSELQGALTAMLDLLKSVNDSMHQIAITGYEVNHISSDLHLKLRMSRAVWSEVNLWPSVVRRGRFASWAGCWCRARSACGSATREAPRAWRSWPASSRCRDTSSCTRGPCSSVRRGRSTETAATRRRRTASSTVWRFVCVCVRLAGIHRLFCNTG